MHIYIYIYAYMYIIYLYIYTQIQLLIYTYMAKNDILRMKLPIIYMLNMGFKQEERWYNGNTMGYDGVNIGYYIYIYIWYQ